MKSKIPSDWHNCATCSNWCGSATSDFFRKWVEFDRNEKGLCVGGFRGCEMQPMASCGQGDQRFK